MIPENFLPVLIVFEYQYNMENSNEKENNEDNFAVPTQTHGKKFTINLPTYLRKLAKYLHAY